MTYATKPFTLIWRIDGEFMSTDIDLTIEQENLNSNELVKMAIREEHQPNFTEQEIAELISIATDYDYPGFMGYELIAAFHAPQIQYLDM